MARDPMLRYRPLDGGWTDPVTPDRDPTTRFRGQAHEGYGDSSRKVTRNLPLPKIEAGLITEARAIGATDVVVELDILPKHLFADGSGVKGNAPEPGFPGVVVRLIGSRFGDLRYACDRFEKTYSGEPPGWHGNMRAIVRTLEALRLVERYGTAHRGEQYAGWAALGAGKPMGAGNTEEAPPTVDEAARILAAGMDGITAEDVLVEPAVALTCFRVASKRLHPDNLHTGDPDAFRRLVQAKDIVDAAHGNAGRP